jgi:SAM-dependent methyltransferase
MSELEKQLNLTGLEVIDIGAGTGRTTLAAAKKAKKVTAVDAFGSVLFFNRKLAVGAGIENVTYLRGDCAHLPLREDSMDASICAWAIIDHSEAYRVLRPGGYMIDLIPAPGMLCGELTPLLADVYPAIITEVAPAPQFDPARPASDSAIEADTWEGVPVIAPTLLHEFTYVADYGDCLEVAAILDRLYGPQARRYILDRQKSTLSWRLQIIINRVKK